MSNIPAVQEDTLAPHSYAGVTIADSETVTEEKFFEKSFLLIKIKLLTFVERNENQLLMDRTTIVDTMFPDCPIRNILARISDKWSLLVLYMLDRPDGGVVRFKQLLRDIPDISQKMLTVTLRTLEEDGYVNRKVYPEVPPRVEYSLTDRARSLIPHVNGLIGWALENSEAIMNDRRKALRKR